MSEMTRRAVLGSAAGGALAGALLPAAAHADRGHGGGHGDGGWLHDAVDWPAFLAGADLIWKRMPSAWFEGPFLGNGFLGSGIYAEPGANAVRFNVQHSQVQDHRPEFGSLFGLARLPIGHLTLTPVGAITGVDWRLDVWNAELRGTVTTAAGSLAVRAFVHSRRPLLVVEVTPSVGEEGVRWAFVPAVAVSPRTRGRTPGLVARLLPARLPVAAGRADAELLLDPALQGGVRDPARRARHGDLRAVAGTDAVAGHLVEPERPVGVLAHPRLQP